jgi:glycosyltransferase involved in cell wall biosynthesis
MRILHCYKTFLPEVTGGIPQIIAALAKGMEPRSATTVLTARYRGFHRRYKLENIDVEAVTSFGTILSMPIAPSFPIVLGVRARHFDVVALHAPFPLNDVGIICGIRKPAVVIHWHSEIVGQRDLVPIVAPFIKLALACAQRIIVSDRSMLEGSDFLRPHAGKCVAIPFGVNLNYWQALAPEQKRRVEMLRTAYPRLIVASGRLVSYKGFDVLIDAMTRIDAQVVIIGDGPLGNALRETARRRGVDDRLVLTGHVPADELKIYLHAARVFAFPSVSRAETFGISQIEAMAVGLPIVNTALTTGVPRVARHGTEALTVPPQEPDELSASLSRLLDDPELARRLGNAGRARARDEYAEATFINRVEQVYADAMAAAAQASA